MAWGWGEYVPVAKRREKAKRYVEKLKKQGNKIDPVEIEGRKIARTFWGELWCEHLENFADFDNRLPRGRTYIRNGSVLHLEIQKGYIKALVSGSSTYQITIKISELVKEKWQNIQQKCSGQVGSLLELLSGEVSEQVMGIVSDPKTGLFPSEEEIECSCDCLDWAYMCKHVAAVLYGVGHRLDTRPELLFELRGVDAFDLIASAQVVTETTKTENLLEEGDLSELFGIDFDEKEAQFEKPVSPLDSEIDLSSLTGRQLQLIRLENSLSVTDFAKKLQLSAASIYNWEKSGEKLLKLSSRSKQAIQQFMDQPSYQSTF